MHKSADKKYSRLEQVYFYSKYSSVNSMCIRKKNMWIVEPSIEELDAQVHV